MSESHRAKLDLLTYGIGITVAGKRVCPSTVTIWKEYDTEGETYPDITKTIKALESALLEATVTLKSCYNVTEWPCNGQTRQDLAIARAEQLLQELKL